MKILQGRALFWLICGILLLLNVIGFALMGVDKKRAQNREWRIRESVLFLTAIIGGSIGSILGMQIFRHKTKHKSFVIGMPVILILQIAAAIWFFLIR